MTPLAAGAPAPAFSFTEDGAMVELLQRCRDAGALVLFLPLAYAPVCCEDVRALARAAGELGAPRRPLVVVSVDRDLHLRRFLHETGAGALAHRGDPELELAEAYGVRRREEFAARASFLVGPDGRVAASAVHPIGFPRPIELLKGWSAQPGPASTRA